MIRPYAPYNPEDAYLKQFSDTINSHTLHAGRGISIEKGQGGLVISSTIYSGRNGLLNYRGTYDTASQYLPNDVVFVDPNITYYTRTESISTASSAIPWEATSSFSRPPICAGLFVCVTLVPYYTQDYGVYTGSVLPNTATSSNQQADVYRHNQYNCYYPVYPTIPISSRGWVGVSASAGNYLTVGNQTFWMPLTPYLPARFCYNNVETTMFLAGIVSGSTFDTSKRPYTGSFAA